MLLGEIGLNAFVFGTSLSYLTVYANALSYAVFYVQSITVALIPMVPAAVAFILASFSVLKKSLSCCCFGLLASLFAVSGALAVLFGGTTLLTVYTLCIVALNPGDTLALHNHSKDAEGGEWVQRVVFRVSDTMLGMYTSCCAADIIGPCASVVAPNRDKDVFCYFDLELYENGVNAIPDVVTQSQRKHNVSFCQLLELPPAAFCPNNDTGIIVHDIPGFLDASYNLITPRYSFIAYSSMVAGIFILFLALVFCITFARPLRDSKDDIYTADSVEYGTPIKEANSDVVLV